MRAFCLSLGMLLLLLSGKPCLATEYADVYEVRENPLALRSTEQGDWPTFDAGDRSAFYLVDGNRRIHLEGAPIESDRSATAWRLVYRTEDDRTATLRIVDGPNETVRITFWVDTKTDYERLGVQLSVTETEGFSGLMERVVQGSQGLSWRPGMEAALNLRGQSIDLYILPTVSIYAPFFLSTSGWGIHVASDWPGTYRFGIDERNLRSPTQVTIEQEGPILDLLVLPGPDPMNVIQRYARITGLPLMPPDYLFGPGRWRDECWDLNAFYDGEPYDGPYNSMIVEDVLMMDALDIPCSWMVVDRPWASGTFGYGNMTPDDTRFPGFADMVSWLDRQDIDTLLWIGPWVMDGQRDLALGRGYDVTLTFPYLPHAALIDFTDSEAADWWMSELQPLFDAGISGFKLDRGEEKPPDGQVFSGFYHDGTSYREGHNAYPLWFAQTVLEAARRAEVEDFVSIYRAGWTGMSAVSTAWGGDSDPSPWGLRSAIIALQRASVLNTPIWGSDTGGYNARAPREVLARWLAFSAFCPVMEVGPTANLAPWSWLDDESTSAMGPDGYPADAYYDAELLAIWAMYARIHSDLIPYTKALAVDAHAAGTPIVRPMFVAFPDHPEFIDHWDQYLLGADLLVRPVWEPGIESVDVLVPQGTWIDLWTGTAYAGPITVTVDVPPHVIPLFMKQGSDLALSGLETRWRQAIERTATPPDLSGWRLEMERF